jgi:hypothetical protein
LFIGIPWYITRNELDCIYSIDELIPGDILAISQIGVYLLVGIVLLSIYSKIWHIAKQQQCKITTIEMVGRVVSHKNTIPLKATKMVAVILGAFIISWMPYIINYLVNVCVEVNENIYQNTYTVCLICVMR